MSDNFNTVAPESTAPLALPVATKQLDDNSHAGVSVIVDKTGARSKMLVVNADGSINVVATLAGIATAANQATGNATLLDILAAVDAVFGAVDGLEGKDYATQTTLALMKTAIDNIYTKLQATLAVTGTFWQATQPVSAASLPLPSNAAKETGGNLDTLVSLVTALNLYVDSLESLITTTNGKFGAAQNANGWLPASGSIGATKTDIGTANTPGQLGGWYIGNSNASVVYVQFFNAQASAVTLGTTPPTLSLMIPASSAANVAAGAVGIQFGTAISIAITTTRSGSTGPGSTVDYNLFYKQ